LPAPLRIGVFGGTFNPIHVCHLRVAARAKELVGLDRVVFVPAAHPPHKADEKLVAARHRLEMTRLAIAGRPGFEVDDLELRRPGPSYSVDTLDEFRRRHPAAELYFLVGVETFLELSTWREPHRLFAASRVVVIARAGRSFEALAGVPWIGNTPRAVLAGFDATTGEAALDLGPTARVVLVKIAPCDISSTQVREDLAAGRAVKNLLPAPVYFYILEHRLYGARDAGA